MFRLFKKYSLFLFCGIIFFVVIALLIEGAGYLYEKHLLKKNPLIAASLAGEERVTASESQDQPLSESGQLPASPSASQSGAAPKLNPDTLEVVETFLTEPNPDNDVQMQRRLDFRSWSGQAREYYTRFTRETVMVFNAENTLRHCYGVDASYFEGNQRAVSLAFLHHAGILTRIYEALATARDTDQAVELSLPWSEHIADSPVFTAWCVPGLRTGPAWAHDYLFVARHPEKIERPGKDKILEDSPFEFKDFRFKASYVDEASGNFSTNRLSFRDVERDLPKAEESLRILCIGDDATVEGRENSSTYPALLEQSLAALLPEHTVEVLNIGTSGINSSGHLLRFFEYMALEPDMVLFQPGTSDLLDLYHTRMINFLPSFSCAARWFLPEMLAPSSSDFSTALEHALGINLNLFLLLLKEQNVPCVLLPQPGPDPELLSKEETAYFTWQGKETFGFPAFSLKAYTRLLQITNRLLEDKAQAFDLVYFPADKTAAGTARDFQDFRQLTEQGIERKVEMLTQQLLPLIETLLK